MIEGLPWQPGPLLGNDPVDSGTVECGDRFLVAVGCVNRHGGPNYWDTSVVVATEYGWDDSNGDSWGAWSWSDVEWFIKLDRKNLPKLAVLPELPKSKE